jgi:cytokinin dehydrogenase
VSGAAFATAIDAIRRGFRGSVVERRDALNGYARDFGGMVEHRPRIVLCARDVEDVSFALRVATDHGVPVTPRGAGHSQAGQGLGVGIVLDMCGVGGPPALDASGATLELGAGCTWDNALEATLRHGMIPLGMTHALDPTVGGTLSVAGIGAESYRVGPQVDNLRWADVATPNGEIVRADLDHHRELFDAVRGGLGQCGVILRAGYPVRATAQRVRTEAFAFRDAEAFIEGVNAACDPSAGPHFVSATLARNRWMPGPPSLVLMLGREYTELEDLEARPLPDLGADLAFPVQDGLLRPGPAHAPHPFFRLFGEPPAGTARLHPWVEHLFEGSRARDLLELLLEHPPAALGHGTLRFIFLRRGPTPAPLFRVPPSDGLLWGLGMFTEFPESDRTTARKVMVDYARRMRPFAGIRYPSGFAPFGEATCAFHYGDAWLQYRDWKRRFDPRGVLSPGFIDWDARE